MGSSVGLAARSIIVVALVLAFELSDARQSFAGCGGYCEARQARTMCHQAVNAQDVEIWAREAEFEKCKADPARYLELEGLTSDETPDFD